MEINQDLFRSSSNNNNDSWLIDHKAKRHKRKLSLDKSFDPNKILNEARFLINTTNYLEAIDLYEQLSEVCPEHSISLLSELYDQYRKLPSGLNRYNLYVARDYDFKIKSGEKVLDIGSGHDPFPYATHLADFAPNDDSYGRNGVALKTIAGKPFTECNVEDMPFNDKEFDFIYCSHVLEHTIYPEKACQEIMRVAKRGYIETPSPGKDMWMNSAKSSNHNWGVENILGCLRFKQYSEEEKSGLSCNILMEMHCSPQTEREKAISALIWLKSRQINTMLYWEDSFSFEVIRQNFC